MWKKKSFLNPAENNSKKSSVVVLFWFETRSSTDADSFPAKAQQGARLAAAASPRLEGSTWLSSGAKEQPSMLSSRWMQNTGGRMAPAPRMPVGNRWLRDPAPQAAQQSVCPDLCGGGSGVCLPVWGRAAAHFKRSPDPILKALKRPGSNLTIKSKQWLLRKSLRLYNTANFAGHKDMPMVTREGASVPIRMWRRPPPLPRWRGCKYIFSSV